MGEADRFVRGAFVHELKIKGSRFIAEAFGVEDVDDALSRIDVIRRREHAATHHCWAYRIDADTFRFNDDGEPSGTAGAPILRQIEGRELINTLVVVTRYYGGTKLGTGGLIRAYGDAAAGVLDISRIETRIRRVTFDLEFDYADTSAAMQALSRFDAPVVDSDYGTTTKLRVAVREVQADAFEAAYIEATAARGMIRRQLD